MKEIVAFLVLASVVGYIVYRGWKRGKSKGKKHPFVDGLAYGFLAMAALRLILYLLNKAGFSF